jgi:hypothetical protein
MGNIKNLDASSSVMPLKILLCIICIVRISYGQDDTCSCGAVLVKKDKIFNVFDKPDGKVKYKIIDDTKKENYYSIGIINKTNDWAQIVFSALYDSTENKGWIKINNLGIYPGEYSKPLLLYSNPQRHQK